MNYTLQKKEHDKKIEERKQKEQEKEDTQVENANQDQPSNSNPNPSKADTQEEDSEFLSEDVIKLIPIFKFKKHESGRSFFLPFWVL